MKRAWLILTNVCRVGVALTFIVSGFVKAVDPLGTQYKIHDYVAATPLQYMPADWMLLIFAVALSAAEFTLGVLLLFAINRRTVSRAALAFMVFMTGVSVWLIAADPVADCGCFGDAIKLTNAQTLFKNIVLLAMTVVLCLRTTDMARLVSNSNQWIVKNYTVLFIIGVSVWGLYDLPVLDFRPYHEGADIRKGMEMPEDAAKAEFATTFIMEKGGVRREFSLDDYPDSTWTFIDTRTVRTKEGYTPPIHDFCVQTRGGEDVTDSLLSVAEYGFWLISPHIETADDADFGDINCVYEYAANHGYGFTGITSSGEESVERWSDMTGAEYGFLVADDITLKTMIRSNPGLMLVREGVILRKWSHSRLPGEEELARCLDVAGTELASNRTMAGKVLNVTLWFVLPLLLLTLADRLWAWSEWVRRKQREIKEKSISHTQNIISSTIKKGKENEKENCGRKLEDEHDASGRH